MSPGFSDVRMAEVVDRAVVALAVDGKVKKKIEATSWQI
jgi:hypothetical protein